MSEPTPDLWNAVLETAERAVEKHGIPGISLGILKDGESRTAALGVANLETQLPLKEETVFQIGSISKTFAAALAMQMVEQGAIDLDTPLRAYLPRLTFADPHVTENVTAYHLLTHSGGWDGDFFIDTGEGADAMERQVARMPEREQIAPLGKYMGYNNAGFVILGHLLEQISGQPYETLLRERIFEPLGMQAYLNANETIARSFAVGHVEGKVAHPWYLPSKDLPAGAIVTSARGLLAFAKLFLDGGQIEPDRRLLSADIVATMFSPQFGISDQDRTSICLSWFRREYDGLVTITHGGATNGQNAHLLLVPGRQFALAFLSNASNGYAAAAEIIDCALETYFAVPPKKPEPIPSTVDDLKPLVGSFRNQFFELHTNLVHKALVGIMVPKGGFPTEKEPPGPPSPPFTLQRCAKNRLIVADGAFKGSLYDILRDDDGQVAYLRARLRLLKFTPG